MRAVFLLSVMALALSACGPRESQAAGEPTPKQGERAVNWGEAKQAQPAQAPLSPGLAPDPNSAAAKLSPVPVLTPPPVAGAAAAGLEAGSEMILKPTPDGYFARIAGKAYDITIHGTKAFLEAPVTAPKPGAVDTTKYRFETGEGQAQVSFSKFGVDYLVQFDCKGDPMKPCITEAEALAYAQKLQVAP
jgi:hypothetical protein